MFEGRFKALTQFSFTTCLFTAAVNVVGLEGFIFFLAAAMTEGLMQENP
jgi:hypothetical protein